MANKKGSTIKISTDKRGRTTSISVSGPAANAFFHGMAKASEKPKIVGSKTAKQPERCKVCGDVLGLIHRDGERAVPDETGEAKWTPCQPREEKS